MKVVLVGYYGFQNLGDDLMMEGAAETLASHPGVSRVVVFKATGATELASHPAVRFADLSGKSGKVRLLFEIARSDRVLWGGGTCIYEPDDGALSGLRFLASLARVCRRLRRPLSLCGVGIGSLRTDAAVALARAILSDAGSLSFRDPVSASRAVELGASPARVRLAGDLFFLSVPTRSAPSRRDRPRTVSFSGVHLYAADAVVVEHYARMLRGWLDDPELNLVFLPVHRGEHSDHAFHAEVARRLPPGRFRFGSFEHARACAEVLSTADVHVGMRLHSIALADSLGIPNIGLEYSPKVARYIEKSRMGEYRRLFGIREEVTTEQLRDAARLFVQNVAFLEAERGAARAALIEALE